MTGDTYLTDEGRYILRRVWCRYRSEQARYSARARAARDARVHDGEWVRAAGLADDMTSGRAHPANVDPAAWYEVCREQLAREGGR